MDGGTSGSARDGLRTSPQKEAFANLGIDSLLYTRACRACHVFELFQMQSALRAYVPQVVQLYADLAAGYEGMVAENMIREQDEEGCIPSQAGAPTGPTAVAAPEPRPPAQPDAAVPLEPLPQSVAMSQ